MIEEILRHRIRRCAMVGTAKNVGKTTALNALAAGAAEAGLRPGLVSFGRDGEAVDALTGDPKPPVRVPPEGIFATIRSLVSGETVQGAPTGTPPDARNGAWDGARNGEDGSISMITGTGVSTALGEVGIFRNGSREARMKLMGVNRVSTMLEIQRRIQPFCDFILVDGALDRRSPAMPLIADGVFLATGAAQDGDPVSLIGKTVDSVRHLNIETGEIGLTAGQKSVLESGLPAVLAGPDWRPGTERLSLSGENPPEWNSGETLVLAGALNEAIAGSLMERCGAGFTGVLAVRDATAVFLSETTRRRLAASGIELKAIDGIRLLGITVNPWTPYGETMDSRALVKGLGKTLEETGHPLPVWDVVSGETWRPDDAA